MDKERFSEATEDKNGRIRFSGMLRIVGALIMVIWLMIGGVTAYAYVVILPAIANNMISNDRMSRERDDFLKDKIYENRVLIAKISSLDEQIKSMRGELNIMSDNIRHITENGRRK